jgi:hypothetical protein
MLCWIFRIVAQSPSRWVHDLVEFLIDINKFYNVDGEGFVICNGRWVVILLVALNANEYSLMYGCDFFGSM